MPAATFVGYHQAERDEPGRRDQPHLPGPADRLRQCHDHPFDHWKRTQFHELAAFFARTKAKLSRNDGGGTWSSVGRQGRVPAARHGRPGKQGQPRCGRPCSTAPRSLTRSQSDDAAASAIGRTGSRLARQSLVCQGLYQSNLGPADRPRRSTNRSTTWAIRASGSMPDVHEALAGAFRRQRLRRQGSVPADHVLGRPIAVTAARAGGRRMAARPAAAARRRSVRGAGRGDRACRT